MQPFSVGRALLPVAIEDGQECPSYVFTPNCTFTGLDAYPNIQYVLSLERSQNPSFPVLGAERPVGFVVVGDLAGRGIELQRPVNQRGDVPQQQQFN